MKRPKLTRWPWPAQMPALTTLADAPIRIALPPRVVPNIMAMKMMGWVAAGQSVKPAASAISAASTTTR